MLCSYLTKHAQPTYKWNIFSLHCVFTLSGYLTLLDSVARGGFDHGYTKTS